MKQNEIAIIILIAGFVAISSFFLANNVVKVKEYEKVPVVEKISGDITLPPDPTIFNEQSIDLTVPIKLPTADPSSPLFSE